MKKVALILSFISIIVLSNPVFSEEIYALLVSDAKSSVYRVATSDEFRYPIGYFFDCNKANEFYIARFRS